MPQANHNLASLGKISGLNFKAAFMFPLIFILPCHQYKLDLEMVWTYLHKRLLGLGFSWTKSDEDIIEHQESGIGLNAFD